MSEPEYVISERRIGASRIKELTELVGELSYLMDTPQPSEVKVTLTRTQESVEVLGPCGKVYEPVYIVKVTSSAPPADSPGVIEE